MASRSLNVSKVNGGAALDLTCLKETALDRRRMLSSKFDGKDSSRWQQCEDWKRAN